MKKYKSVITYGTFDLFHNGHLKLLKRINEQTEKLYIGVSSDRWNVIKGKKSKQNENIRLKHIENLYFVDGVFLEDHNDHTDQWLDDYREFNAETIIMGSDHEGILDKFMREEMKIEYLSRTEGISSTQLRENGATLKGITWE